MSNDYVVSIDFVSGKNHLVEGDETNMYLLYQKVKDSINHNRSTVNINYGGVEFTIVVDKIVYIEIYNRDRYSSM